MKIKENTYRERGFTLIELLVAMGIIAVLTGLAIFNFNQSRVRARDVQRKNDLKQLQTALELYKNDANGYPPTISDTGVTWQQALINANFMKTKFVDPRGSEWVDYVYLPVTSTTYYLETCLENQADTAKTTNTTWCTALSSVNCTCGSAGAGVMYIQTQP